MFQSFNFKYTQVVFAVVGLSILIPATVDRLIFNTVFTKSDDEVNMYAIISFIDMLMIFSVIAKKNIDDVNKFKGYISYNPIMYRQLAIISLVILSSIVAGIFSSNYHLPAAIRGIFYFIRYIGIFFWVRFMINDINSLYHLNVTVFVAFIGIVFLVFLSPKENYEGGDRLSVATFGVNTFGHILNFFSLLSLPFIIVFKKNKNYLLFFAMTFCLIVMLLFLFLSGNRSSTLIFAVSTVFFLLLRPGKLYSKLLFLFFSTLFIFFFFIVLLSIKPDTASRILETFQVLSGNYALEDIKELQTRFFVWDVCSMMIEKHPFLGIGPAQWNFFKNVYGDFPYWITGILDPHNSYLLLASEIGLPATILYYSTLITAIRNGFKSIKLLKAKLKNHINNTSNIFLIDCLLILNIIIIDWLLSDLTNASVLNLRVQSILWVFSSILLISPILIIKKIRK